MAALAQTVANVGFGGTGTTKDIDVQAGEAMVAGNWYYRHTDGKMYKCDADAVASAAVRGMVVTPAVAIDGYFVGVRSGPVIVGGTMTVGMGYYIHTTAGAMGEIGELGSGDFPSFLGFAISATVLQADPVVATIAKA